MPYHEGELAVQRRAGVAAMAAKVGRIIGSDIPAIAAQFLAERRFVVTSTVAADGAVTASLLAGRAHALDPRTIRIEALRDERVFSDVAATGTIGLLAIDFSTKRRMRVNGTAAIDGDALLVTTNEVYSNCPQYIHVEPTPQDTFFIATVHPTAGADASHRGGPPGFVTIETTRYPLRYSWPDYPGNNMFNTLGNLSVNPRCGLLFVDFDTGAMTQVRGRAAVEWEGEGRSVVVEADEVIRRAAKTP
jgi:predicted pyridoxine 5'-phosphate oxidase superfamily flavin-nucleotide-binding protein